MSGILRWREEWTLQVDVLDDDHRALVELFNRILVLYGEPAASGADSDQEPVSGVEAEQSAEKSPAERLCPARGFTLIECLDQFHERAREHFVREEAFMRSIGYPERAAHKLEHDLLLAEFTDLTRGVRERGATILDADTLDGLKGWLIGHAIGEDKRVAEFYFGICGMGPEEEALFEHEVE